MSMNKWHTLNRKNDAFKIFDKPIGYINAAKSIGISHSFVWHKPIDRMAYAKWPNE